MATKDFDSAVSALYSNLHQAKTAEALRKTATLRSHSVEDMREYMRRCRLELPKSISIVHITGTKGKGSTACMCESILRERYQLRTGLFTSPHLVDIRERIRVCGLPVSRKVFGQAYWDLRDRLEQHTNEGADLPVFPGYFRMLVLMATYIFARYDPPIDVVILEVGMGGRYDATNIFDMNDRNVVCGVTLLDLDHVRVLGNTLEQIAWEKGGIFKVHKEASENTSPRPDDTPDWHSADISATQLGTPPTLFSIDTNTPSTLKVLWMCAINEGMGKQLQIISENPLLENMKLGLAGPHQIINASLAIALCTGLMQKIAAPHDLGLPAMKEALSNASWPGRCQTVSIDENFVMRLDGAHTPKSLYAGWSWFETVATKDSTKVLVFNCSHERNPVHLIQILRRTDFATVYFCPADFERPSSVDKPSSHELLEQADLPLDEKSEVTTKSVKSTWQDTLAEIWLYFQPDVPVVSNLKVADALARIRKEHSGPVETLVAGSLYIVGSALASISWEESDAQGCLQVTM